MELSWWEYNNSCSICMTMLTCDPCKKSGPCSWVRNYSNYKSVTGGSDNGILHVLSLVFWTVSIILCFKVNVALQKPRLFQCQVKGQRGMHLRAYSNYPWSWKRNKIIHHTRTVLLEYYWMLNEGSSVGNAHTFLCNLCEQTDKWHECGHIRM